MELVGQGESPLPADRDAAVALEAGAVLDRVEVDALVEGRREDEDARGAVPVVDAVEFVGVGVVPAGAEFVGGEVERRGAEQRRGLDLDEALAAVGMVGCDVVAVAVAVKGDVLDAAR